MTFRQLRYLVEVAERLNFTAAAEHLYMAQSTLSRQIALLEEEFGVDFFLRDKSGLALTQAGEIFYAEAKSILAREQQLRARVENASRGKPEQLRLGVLEGTCPPERLIRSISILRDEYPGIDIMIRPLPVHEIYMQLEAGAIDMVYAFDHNVELVPDVVCVPAAVEQMYLAASRHYHAVAGGALRFETIREILGRRELMILEPALFGQQMVPRLRKVLSDSLSDVQLDMLRYVESEQQLIMNVVCGMGAAMVHQSHNLCRMPDVVLCPIPEVGTPVRFVLGYRSTNTNPAIPVFLDAFTQTEE